LAAPDAPVCRIGGNPKIPATTTTYRELDEQSGRFAAGLREIGLSSARWWHCSCRTSRSS
jgi:acyl-CoA synthetase (AMP-forming)/AMP-acid ligase II